MAKKLFYTYTGKWSSNVVPTSLLYPDSIIFHKSSKRIIQNGTIYGGGNSGMYYIEGKSTDTIGQWTGINTDIPENYEGLTIIYIPKVNAGSSSTTLNINGYGSYNCIVNNENITDKHYGINDPIILTYMNNQWKRCDYAPNQDAFNTLVYNKDGENTTYNIVFTEKSSSGTYTFSYVDADLRFNPSTNTLFVGSLTGRLNSLYADGTHSYISNVDRRTITNIGITLDKKIAYIYSESIGARYYNNSYYGEIFSDYDTNIATGTYSSAFGHSTKAENSYEVAFGTYNKPNDDQIFSIGVGKSDDNRYNAMWVDINGTTYMTNIIPQKDKAYNIGSTGYRYSTIYSDYFNGNKFTGTSDFTRVLANSTSDAKYIVGFDNSTKILYFENSLTFTDDGQLNIRTPNGTAPMTIISKTLVSNLNADMLDGKHLNELLTNAYISTYNDSTCAYLTYYMEIGGRNVNGKQLLYNNRLAGNNSYSAWGQTFWGNGIPRTIYGSISNSYTITAYETNKYNLGSVSIYWGSSYITGIYTNSVAFGGDKDIGNGLNFTYWKNGRPVPSSSNKGSNTKPIYLKDGVFTECTNGLDVNVHTGTQYRLAYYSNTNEISSGNNIWTNGTKLAINSTGEPTQTLFVNGTSMFKNIINIDSNAIGGANHINFNRASWNYINVPTNGTLAICINNASSANTRLAVDANSVYPGANHNTINLGTASSYWKDGYIKDIHTSSIAFDGNKDIGNTTRPVYWQNGSPKLCQSYADFEASSITSFIKTLTVTKNWTDTGIAGNNLSTGTYIIQMIVGTNIYYSGVISWYADSTSSTETDEIVLHMAGKNPTERIYLKTTMVSSGNLKLQISGSSDWSSTANIEFKFKKLI